MNTRGVTAATDWPEPVEIVNQDGVSHFVLTCEHAARHMPRQYDGLGLSEPDLRRHIAWDIGVAGITRILAERLDAPAFLGTYSRLLIDLNRPLTADSLMPVLSESTQIPGNIDLSETERRHRLKEIFLPYHKAVARHLEKREKAARQTLIAAIHSFTPVFFGKARPWHAGILFARSSLFAHAVIAELARDRSMNIAPNEPYVIDRAGDYTVPIHGEDRGHPAILIEVRQDLISDEAGVIEWSDRLFQALAAVDPALASRFQD